MAKSRKKSKAEAPKKKKSKLPDIISGKYVLARTDSSLLLPDGQTWASGGANPYIFPSKPYAQAYLDGMSEHLKEGMQVGIEALSAHFDQSFQVTYGAHGDVNVVVSMVPKGEGVTFKAAVRKLEAECFTGPIHEQQVTMKELEGLHKRELIEREKTHKSRMKDFGEGLKRMQKEHKEFTAAIRKLS